MNPAERGARASEDPRLAFLMLLGAIVSFGVLDTFAKWLARDHPVVQVVWARYFFSLVVLLPFLARAGAIGRLRSARPGVQLIRAGFLAVATFLFFFAVSRMQLAAVTATGFLSPLIVVAISAIALREHVGPLRWSAVAIGFLGVMVILRPAPDTLTIAALAAFGVPFCNALYNLATRQLSSVDPATTTLAWTGAVGTIAFGLAMPFAWTWPDAIGWGAMFLMGASGAAGHGFLILAYRNATPSALAPYSYLSLPWVTLLGFAVFGDVPDRWTVIGALAVIASGIFVYFRERHLRRIGRL
jgi:drug/metabolite transporter (DMT)-like permease